jgi:hypothetical protein
MSRYFTKELNAAYGILVEIWTHELNNPECLEISAIFGPESARHFSSESQKDVKEEFHSLEVIIHHKLSLSILNFCDKRLQLI